MAADGQRGRWPWVVSQLPHAQAGWGSWTGLAETTVRKSDRPSENPFSLTRRAPRAVARMEAAGRLAPCRPRLLEELAAGPIPARF